MTGTLLTAARRQAARTLGTAGAVLIAVAFVVATLVLSDSLGRTLAAGLGAPFAGIDAYVSGDAEAAADGSAVVAVTPDVVAAVAAAPGVEAVAVSGLRGATGPDAPQGFVGLEPLAEDRRLRFQELTAGRWPSATGEVVTASSAFTVGQEVRLRGPEDTEVTLLVVGAVSPATASDPADLLASPASLDLVNPGEGWAGLRVVGSGGDQAVAAAVRTALESTGSASRTGLVVQTGEDMTAAAVSEATGQRAAPTLVLLVFAAISVLVAALVIANTRTVVLAQRLRQLALLRCVGATRAQLIGSAMTEAALVGLAASVLGAALGVGIAAMASALVAALDAPIPVAELAVRPGALLVGTATGLGVTLLAAVAPTIRASRVAPVVALHPIEASVSTRRASRLRIVLGTLLAVPASIALVLLVRSVPQSDTVTLLIAFALGVLSFVGVVVLAQPMAAAAVGVVDGWGRRGLPPAMEVALANARRNPHRTGATAAALLIGVTLIATVTVGASTLRASAGQLVAGNTPADVVLLAGGPSAPLPADVAALVGGVAGVADSVVLSSPSAGVTMDGAGMDVRAVAVASRSEVLLVGDTSAPPRGTIRLSGSQAAAMGLVDGAQLPLTGSAGDVVLTAEVAEAADLAAPVPLVAAEDLTALAGTDVYQSDAFVRLDDGLGRDGRADTVAAVEGLMFDVDPATVVTAPVLDRDQFEAVLDGVLLVAAALLGVAVIIAVVGVGTTLSLGVHERRQENGLLRALGMTRRQVRAVVVGEAVLLSLLAAVAGVLLGAGYGAAGSAAALGSAGFTFDVPAGRTALLVAVTLVAGVLAAAVPAMRAGRVSPVVAMVR